MSGETWVVRETVTWSRVVVVGPGGTPRGKVPVAGRGGVALERVLSAVGEGSGGRLGAGAVGTAALLALGLGVARVVGTRGGMKALPRGWAQRGVAGGRPRAALPPGPAALPERTA